MTHHAQRTPFAGAALTGAAPLPATPLYGDCSVCGGEGTISLVIPSPANPFQGMTVQAPCHVCQAFDDGGGYV